jgi:AraC-like DNA-binding protein
MLIPLIDLVIVFHCLVFGMFFLFRKGGIGRSNLYLAILLFLLAIMSLPFAIKPTNLIFYVPYIIDLEWAAGFLFAPFYLWFVREMTGEKTVFNWKELLQVIPAVAALLYFSKFYFKSAEEQLEYLRLTQFTYIEDYQIGDAIFYPYIQGYFIYVIVLLYRRKNKVSGIYLSNLQWLRKYTLILLIFGFCGAIIFMLQLPQIYIDIVPLASASLYMVIIYRFLQQSGKNIEEESPLVKEEKKESKLKYSGSNLSPEEAERLNNELQKLMQQDKLFLQSELTLQTLSQALKISAHHLSQVINQYHEKNFSDFINAYRIEEAKKIILGNTQLKLEAVGYECGFNTKTTFYASFKKYTGSTPSEFRKSHS